MLFFNVLKKIWGKFMLLWINEGRVISSLGTNICIILFSFKKMMKY